MSERGGHDYGPSGNYTLAHVARRRPQVTDAIATNELPVSLNGVFELYVQGTGLTPERGADVTVVSASSGRKVADGHVTANSGGGFSWTAQVENVNCNEDLVATVRDETTGVLSEGLAFAATCPEEVV